MPSIFCQKGGVDQDFCLMLVKLMMLNSFTVDVVDDHGGVLTCSSQTPRFYQCKAARGASARAGQLRLGECGAHFSLSLKGQ